jgi:hypothetical protein
VRSATLALVGLLFGGGAAIAGPITYGINHAIGGGNVTGTIQTGTLRTVTSWPGAST